MPENGEKKLIRKLLIWALGTIITLMSILGGIVWASVKKNTDSNNIQNERLAKLEQGYTNIEKRLDQIYDEVKDKK